MHKVYAINTAVDNSDLGIPMCRELYSRLDRLRRPSPSRHDVAKSGPPENPRRRGRNTTIAFPNGSRPKNDLLLALWRLSLRNCVGGKLCRSHGGGPSKHRLGLDRTNCIAYLPRHGFSASW